jgi:hypothetical protein
VPDRRVLEAQMPSSIRPYCSLGFVDVYQIYITSADVPIYLAHTISVNINWYRRKYVGTAAKPMGEDTELPIDAGLHSHSGSKSGSLLKERKKTPKSSDQGRHVLTHQGADSRCRCEFDH